MIISSVYIAGLGLIGGSFLKKLNSLGGFRLSGWDYLPEHQKSSGLSPSGLEAADLILLCMPPSANISFLQENAPRIRAGALAANCAGVQAEAMESCAFLEKRRVFYLGAHPMAGSEQSGYEAARPGLFEGAPLILCPSPYLTGDILQGAEGFFRDMGFGSVRLMGAEEHDRAVALVSQLPHVLAALLMNMQTGGSVSLAGGALADMTRIAEFNAPLWAELFLANRAMLLAALEEFSLHAEEFKSALAEGNKDFLLRYLEESTQKRRQYFSKKIDKA